MLSRRSCLLRYVVEAEYPGNLPLSASIAPQVHELRNGLRFSVIFEKAMLTHLNRAELGDRVDAKAPLHQHSPHAVVPGTTSQRPHVLAVGRRDLVMVELRIFGEQRAKSSCIA